jgi:hypothetical protein
MSCPDLPPEIWAIIWAFDAEDQERQRENWARVQGDLLYETRTLRSQLDRTTYRCSWFVPSLLQDPPDFTLHGPRWMGRTNNGDWCLAIFNYVNLKEARERKLWADQTPLRLERKRKEVVECVVQLATCIGDSVRLYNEGLHNAEWK